MAKVLFVIVCMSVLFFPIHTHSDMASDVQYDMWHFHPGSNEMQSPYYTPNFPNNPYEYFHPGGNEMRSPYTSNVYIINDSYDTLHFYYRSEGQQWEEIVIPDRGRRELPCNGRTAANIRVITGDRYVEYSLRCREIYVLFWNTAKGLWDVQLLTD